jgi:hypothetical protein
MNTVRAMLERAYNAVCLPIMVFSPLVLIVLAEKREVKPSQASSGDGRGVREGTGDQTTSTAHI